MVDINVHPELAMVDDLVSVTVTGLQPRQPVTFYTRTFENKAYFVSYAHFLADKSGCLDLSSSESLGGSYRGVDQMGFIWSMELESGQRNSRICKVDVTTPLVHELFVIDGHIQSDKDCAARSFNPLAYCACKRTYLSDTVERIPYKEGGIRGTLFVPKDGGRYPGVMDLFGGAGGLIEFRAALLASKGFVVLALAYFGHPDLESTSVFGLSFDYFVEAVNRFSEHERVLPGGIGFSAVCKGSELAILCSIYLPAKVRAVVSISGRHFLGEGDMSYKGKFLPGSQPNFKWLIESRAKNINTFYFGKSSYGRIGEETYLPVEKADAKFLFFCGDDDPGYTLRSQEYMASRLSAHGKTDYEVVVYPGAGHLIEPPYAPLCTESYMTFLTVSAVWGGKKKEHAYAQEDSWRRLQTFLKENLPKRVTGPFRVGHRISSHL